MEDLGAPESWEVADLDATMSRLMLSSSSKKDSQQHQEFSDPPPPASSSDSVSASLSADKVSDDLVSQVDQFLREAIQNPRERLSSKYGCTRFCVYVFCFYVSVFFFRMSSPAHTSERARV